MANFDLLSVCIAKYFGVALSLGSLLGDARFIFGMLPPQTGRWVLTLHCKEKAFKSILISLVAVLHLSELLRLAEQLERTAAGRGGVDLEKRVMAVAELGQDLLAAGRKVEPPNEILLSHLDTC